MLYIESDSTDPYWNLALEEHIFNTMEDGKECFMLWQNKNTIVVGKYQNTAEEINPEFADAQGIRVARRLSGGGAVYHDDGNLNFTYIVNKESNPDFNFNLFVIPVIRALESLGVKAEFNGRNDLTIDGKKFSGNSQYSRRNRIMHHGCIMLDSNLDKVKDALRVKEAKFESKSHKSVRSRVTTINENAPHRITMEEFKEALKQAAFAEIDLEPYELTAADREAIQKLKEEKYETWEWNYGFYPAYSIRRDRKFDSGLVSVSMEVEHGAISQIRLFGDFFGNRDIAELEAGLTGVRLDEHLEEKLQGLHLEDYIHGVTPASLAELLR